MSSLSHHFATMAYANAWANHRLLAAVVRLTQDEFVALRTSFFPSIKRTCNHIVTVDWFYVDAFERAVRGESPNPDTQTFFEPDEPFGEARALRVAQAAVDRRLVDLCVGLSDEQLERIVAIERLQGMSREPLVRLLAHLFQHQIHHRGQVHAMLAGTSVSPPQLDEFFCAEEAPLRAAELAELGYTETMIWGA